MSEIKNVIDELEEFRAGLGLRDKKTLDRLRKAKLLSATWHISVVEIEERPNEVLEQVEANFRKLAEWLDEAKVGYAKDGQDSKRLAFAFRVAFNLEPEYMDEENLTARRQRLMAELHYSSVRTITGKEDLAIRRVAERIMKPEVSNPSEWTSGAPVAHPARPNLHLDGWRFGAVTLEAHVSEYVEMKIYETFEVVLTKDNIDRIGILIDSVPDRTKGLVFSDISFHMTDPDSREVVSRQISENCQHRVFEIGGGRPSGDRTGIVCISSLSGAVVSAYTFTPLNPCDRLIIGLRLEGQLQKAVSLDGLPYIGPNVRLVSGLPPQLVRDWVREGYGDPNVSWRTVRDGSIDLMRDCRDVEPDDSRQGSYGHTCPYVVEFPNPKPGLSYGLIWQWPTTTLFQPGNFTEAADTHFGAFLKGREHEKPRPSPEGEGGDA